MSAPRNLRILASAGTGKTFRLTNRFLELLFQGVEPERILATTFTRKAAGEILHRVLERLVEASEDEVKRAELADAIELPGLEREACLSLLSSLGRNLNAFQVRTIDSFFVHLVKLFALDLELPPDWNICDERVDERLRSDALQGILAEEDPEEIVLLLRELSKGEAGRSVHRTLLGKTASLRPVHLECEPGAWDRLSVGEAVDEEELAQALGALEAAELPTTKDGAPHKSWVKARDTFIARCRAELWDQLVKGGLGEKFLAPVQSFSGKPFPEAMLPAMQVAMGRAVHAILSGIRSRNLAAARLLDEFEEAYRRKKREAGSYGFTDLPYALAPNAASAMPLDERELDRWFRLDGRIDHLLLDEFQDTSPVQWRILENIAGELVAGGEEGRSLFCVGDVKQSIYSFRQAEPRLLDELDQRLPGLASEEMNVSWRSSRIVLETVNHVFAGIEENPVLVGEELETYRRAATRWAHSFPLHEAARELPGAVHAVEARPRQEGEAALVPLLETTVERVQRIVEESPLAEVGILMRRNAAIPRLIHQLREKGIDASGEGGNPLTDARSVLCYLSLLHLTDFPDDSAAAFHVASSPFGAYVDLELGTDEDQRRAISSGLRARLGQFGLSELTRQMAQQVADDERWGAWDKARFAQLLDAAFAFEAEGEPRPSAFIDAVRTQNVESPGGSRVRVMTIHASKGLEFDAVVLPELSGRLIGQRDGVLTERPDPAGPIERATVAPNNKLLPISAELRELYEGLTERIVEDSLSVLYVAMTRAKRRLELILPGPDPEKASKSKAGSTAKAPKTHELLRAALAKHGLHEADEEGLVWSHPDSATGASWAEGIESSASTEAPTPSPALRLAPLTAPRSLPRRSPSSEEGGGKRSAVEALRSQRGADVGTLVHALLEDLAWIEDFAPSEDELAQHPKLLRASPALRETAVGLVDGGLREESIRAALSRSECACPEGSEPEVHSEARFSLVLESEEGQPELWNGAIDRLVLARRDGEVVWAEVLDYKTDRSGEEGLDELVLRYQPQLERYVEVVAERYGLKPSSIRAKLLFLAEGEVRTLD